MSFTNSVQNIVRDYNKVQGVTSPTDLSTQIIRDYNVRYVSIENSSRNPIALGFTTYPTGPVPKPRLFLRGGEIKNIAINPQGSTQQYLWILDPNTHQTVGFTQPFSRNANSFVLRDGINMWWIQEYRRPSYAAAH